MYREFSGESPSAARSFLIALFRLCSKSTKVSEDHSLRRISSRVITLPGFSSKMERMQKGWPGKRMRTPCFRNSSAARFTWKTPKRRTLPGERVRFCHSSLLQVSDRIRVTYPGDCSILGAMNCGRNEVSLSKAEDTTGRERLRFCHSSLLQGLSSHLGT